MQSAGVKINVTILRRALLYLYFLCFLSANTGPDTTTLVTRRDKPLRGNDSMSLVPVRTRNNLVLRYKQILVTYPYLSLISFYTLLTLSLISSYYLRHNYCTADSVPFYGTGTKDLKYLVNSTLLGGTGDTSPIVYNLDTFDKYLYFLYFQSANTGPDTTTLVTRRDKPLRGNDSMSLVPVRIRNNLVLRYKQILAMYVLYVPCIRSHFFTAIGSQQLNYARICCFFRVIPIYSWIRIRSHLNARNCCLLIVIFTFSCIRSHFFTVIGKQQLNYARICCFLRVIPIYSWIRSNFNLFSSCLGAVPDTTTLVTLEVQSPGGNDSVSLVQVRCRLFSLILFNFNFNSIVIVIFIYFIYLLIRNHTFIIKLIFSSIFSLFLLILTIYLSGPALLVLN